MIDNHRCEQYEVISFDDPKQLKLFCTKCRKERGFEYNILGNSEVGAAIEHAAKVKNETR